MINIILSIFKICLNIIYFFFKSLPTKKRILMMSRQKDTKPDDFKLLYLYLSKDYEVIMLCHKLPGKENSTLKDKIKYGLHMFKQMYYLATSKAVILDSYIPTVSILKHKKDLTVFQIWHSIGTLKDFGYDSLGKEEGNKKSLVKILRMHKNYDYAFAASTAYKDYLASGFGMPSNKILISTLPRVDLLKSSEYEENIKRKIYDKYPVLKTKKNILYAPTSRKDEEEFKIKFQELVDNFDFHKYNLIVKLHPLSSIKIENSKVIVPNDFDTFNMLFVTDKLISDYSCLIYEAGVRNIPLYFYDFDLDNYIKTRGITIDYNELPGYKEKNAKKLIEDLNKKYDLDYLNKFINKYVSNTKDCSKKMADTIIKHLK